MTVIKEKMPATNIVFAKRQANVRNFGFCALFKLTDNLKPFCFCKF